MSNLGTTTKLIGNQEMEKSCYLTALKQCAKIIPVDPPMQKRKRAQRKALVSENEFEKVEKEMMEISMEELESRHDDTRRPKLDRETKKEMFVEDPTRAVVVGNDMDPEVK